MSQSTATKPKKFKARTIILIILGIILVIFGTAITIYLNTYYHADSSYNVESQTVQMEKIDGGYFFDGPGESTALIFYPGAKVDTLAYVPLMTSLAENGVDCFLADMPFHLAIFNSNIGEKFLENYSYDTWAISGHSMGGMVAGIFAESHPDRISSLILLAAYPNNPIPDSITLCSIYGSNDGVLTRESYVEAKDYWPSNSSEFILEGGNHAQFANYGPQDGDNEATISREEQQARTVELMLEAIDQIS